MIKIIFYLSEKSFIIIVIKIDYDNFPNYIKEGKINNSGKIKKLKINF